MTSWKSLIKSLFTKSLEQSARRRQRIRELRAAARRGRQTFRPKFELLEDRVVPANFTPGDFVVYQVGDGSSHSGGYPVYIDEFTPNGVLVQSIGVSSAGVNALTSATSGAQSFLTDSADGQAVVLAGYDVAVGSPTSGSMTTIGEVNALGVVDTSTVDSTTGLTVRSATANTAGSGGQIWIASSTDGVQSLVFGSSAAATNVETNTPNTRVVEIAPTSSNPSGQLYVSDDSTVGGNSQYVGNVGTGLPTSGSLSIGTIGVNSTDNPDGAYDYFFADVGSSTPNVLYVTGGDDIYKYTGSGTSWTADGSIADPFASKDSTGITGTVSGNTVTLYVTDGAFSGENLLYKIVDTSGTGAMSSGTTTVTNPSTAPSLEYFHGIAAAPTNSSLAGTTLGTVTGPSAEPTNTSFAVSVPASSNLNGQQVQFEYVTAGVSEPTFTPIGSPVTVMSGMATTNLSISANGSYQIYAYYVGSGSLDAAISTTPLSITIGTPTAPTFTAGSTDSATFPAGIPTSFADPATGNPSTIAYSVTAGILPAGVTLNSTTGTLSGAATAGEGLYTFTITANNGVSPNATQTFSLTVSGATGADTSTDVEEAGPFNAGAYTDLSGTSYEYPSFNLQTFSVTPQTNATGITSVTLNVYEHYFATDDVGGTADLYLATGSGRTVSVTGLKDQAANAFASIDPALDAVGLDGTDNADGPIATASYTPSSADTGILSFTITSTMLSDYPTLASDLETDLADGSMRFILAADTAATSYELQSSTGSPAPSLNIAYSYSAAPFITSVTSAAFTEGVYGAFQVTADGNPLVTSFSSPSSDGFTESGLLPTGVSLNQYTGVLDGTPTQSGIFPITIEANNGVSPPATQSFTLSVFATSASAFTAGNLLTDLVSTSGTAGTASAAYFEEVNPNTDAGVQAFIAPDTGSGAFTETIAPTRPEGYLTDAVNGNSVELAGYNVAAGGTILGSNGVIAVIEPNGTINYSTQIPSADMTETYEAGVTSAKAVVSVDGLGFYVATDDGIEYVPFGNSASTPTTEVSNFYTPNDETGGSYSSTQSPFDVVIAGGQLYGDAGSEAQTDGVPAADGPFTVGNGIPTSGGNSSTILPGPFTGELDGQFLTSEQFSMSPDGTTFLVADARTNGDGGLYEWQNSGFGTFSLIGQYTYASGGATTGLTGLSVTWGADDTPTSIYAVTTGSLTADTTGNSIVSFPVNLPSNGNALTAETIIATAPAGYAYTGVAMTPVVANTTTSTSTSDVTVTPVQGTSTEYTNQTLSATVSGGSNPTGYVSFEYNNGTSNVEIGTAPIGMGGTATLETTGGAGLTEGTPNFFAGTYNIFAVYEGDLNNEPSQSPSTTPYTVMQYPTDAVLTNSFSGSTIPTGSAATFTDTLLVTSMDGMESATTPADTAPTGTVTFYDGDPNNGGTEIGSAAVTVAQVITPNPNIGEPPPALINFQATSVSDTFSTPGPVTIYAVYSGDNNFAGLTTTQTFTVVNGTSTAVTLNSGSGTVVGDTPNFTATVTGNSTAGAPTGYVQFYVNGIAVGGQVPLTPVNGQIYSTAPFSAEIYATETAPGTLTPGVDTVSASFITTTTYYTSTGYLNQPVQANPLGVGASLSYQVGDGSGNYFSAADEFYSNVVYINEYNSTGTLEEQFVMPSVTADGYNALTQEPDNGTGGFIEATSSGNGWVFGGVDYPVGGSAPNSIPASIAFLSNTGTLTDDTLNTSIRGYQLRSVASVDGNEFWVAASTGLWYTTPASGGTTIAIDTAITPRDLEIYNNQLFFSTETTGVNAISGTPPTAAITASQITQLTTGSGNFSTGYGAYGFKFAELDAADGYAADTLYVVNDEVNAASPPGIEKWTYNGSTWSLTATNTDDQSSSDEDTAIAVSVSNGVATIYTMTNTQFAATAGGTITEITDNTGAGDANGNFANATVNTVVTDPSSVTNWHGAALVGAAATTTTVTSNTADAAASGASITLTATITSASGTPNAGTVQFYDNLIQIGSPVALGNNGNPVNVATISVSTALTQTTGDLTPGIHSITAVYSGSGPFAASSGVLNQVVQAQAFGFGDQFIYRVGDGINASNTTHGAAVYVDEYSSNGSTGTLVQSIAMPTSDATGSDGNYYHALVAIGSASNPGQVAGQISLSGNGQYTFLAGYDDTPTATSNPATDNPDRSIARIAANGTITIETINNATDTTDAGFDSYITGVYSPDGNQVYIDGTEQFGIDYIASWQPGQTTVASTSILSLTSGTYSGDFANLFGLDSMDNTLYTTFTTESSAFTPFKQIVYVGTLGTLPTTATTTYTPIESTADYFTDVYFASSTSMYASYQSGSSSNAYGNGGIAKFYYNGSTWTLEGSPITGAETGGTTPTGGTPGFFYLSGSGTTGNVTLYSAYAFEGTATSSSTVTGELYELHDTNAANAGFSPPAAVTTLVTDHGQTSGVAEEIHGAGVVPVSGPATVTHLSVSSGSTAGGTTITITGTNFTPGSTVFFGTVAATSVTVTSPTMITAVSPAEGISTVHVTVVNQTGTPSSTSSADKFSFISPTTTTLTDNGPNSAKLNQTVSFTVDVQVASGNAHAINGEKVYLEEEATNTSAGYNKAATGTLSGSTGSTKAAATFNIPGGFFSSAGNYNIIAVFDADSTHYGSQSGPTVQTMTANTISTSVSMTLNGISPATAGLPIETGYNPTVTVDVAPTQGAESGLKSGSVTIMDTSTSKSVGHGLLSSSGQVTITLDTTGGGNLLQVGNNDLVANFIANSNYSGNNSASQNQVINSLFEVDTMAQTATGFVAVFDAPVNPAPSSGSLTVYGTSPSKYGVGASVDLTVGSTNSEGSLVFDPSSTQATFVVTGGFTSGGAPTAGLLASDTQYTVSLAGVSSTGPVIKDTLGHALAGDDSSAGTNYSSNFTTPTDATEASVNAPYFARGFSEAVNLPNNASNGIPISITVPTGGTAVTSASFVIDFDPAALNVSAAAFTSGFSGSTTINNTTGTISVTLSSGTIAAGSTATILRLTASVPSTTPLKYKEVLNITNIDLNGGSNNGLDGSAVHIAAFVGDMNGSYAYSPQDNFYITQYSLGGGTSGNLTFQPILTAYPELDPKIIGDVNSDGSVNSQDAFYTTQKYLGTSTGNSFLQNIPSGTGSQSSDADPKFYLSNVSGSPGQTITVALSLDVTESGGVPYNSLGAVFEFDPSIITVNSVTTADGTADTGNSSIFTGTPSQIDNDVSTSSVIDNTDGEIRIAQSWVQANPPTLADGTNGDAVYISVTFNGNDTAGQESPLNLVPASEQGAQTTTQYNGEASNVNPYPTDGYDAGIDGSATVLAPSVKMFIQPSPVTEAAGSTFTVQLAITANDLVQYNSDGAYIAYDPSKLAVVSVVSTPTSEGGYGANDLSTSFADDGTGDLRIASSWVQANPPSIDAGVTVPLADITFQVLSSATAGITYINLSPAFGNTTTQFDGETSYVSPYPTSGYDAGIDGVVSVQQFPNDPPVITVPAAQTQLFNPANAVGLHTATTVTTSLGGIQVADLDGPVSGSANYETTTVFLNGPTSTNPGTLTATPTSEDSQTPVVYTGGTTALAIQSATWSATGQVATVTTSTTPGYLVGQTVQISEAAVGAYNGTWQVTSVSASGSSFTFTLPVTSDPGSAGVGGTVVSGIAIQGNLTDLNATLATLVYTPTAGYSGTTNVMVYDDDNGNSNAGGPITVEASTTVTVVGLYISEVNLNKVNTTNPDQYIEVYSTMPAYTIPTGVYLLGINGSAVSSALGVGVVTDSFTLAGFQTGSDGYLDFLEKTNGYGNASPSVEDTNGNIYTNQAGTGQVGFGSGGTSSSDYDGMALHTGSTNRTGHNGDLISDLDDAPETYMLVQTSATITTGTTTVDSTKAGTLNGTFYNGLNIYDSVGILDTATATVSRSYGAITFKPTSGAGTTLSSSVVVNTGTWVADYVGRIGASTGDGNNAWLASVLTNPTGGTAANGEFDLGTNTTPTLFVGQELSNIGGPNTWAPQEYVYTNDPNADNNQHSQVSELTVVFSEPVTVNPAAFTVTDASGNTLSINILTADITDGGTPITSTTSGLTQVVITFNTSGGPAAGDTFSYGAGVTDPMGNTVGLTDGDYYLSTNGADITSGSLYLDYLKNGNLANAQGTEVDEFWRFFGDANGTRRVNNADAAAFFLANNSNVNGASDTIASATANGTTVTATMVGNDPFVVNQSISVNGVMVGGSIDNPYNGTFLITSVSTNDSGQTVITYTALSAPSAPADIEGDGTTDGTASAATAYVWYLDFDMDGNIDAGGGSSDSADLAAFAKNYGKTLS